MKRGLGWAIIAVACCCVPLAAQADALARGKGMAEAFLAGDTAAVWTGMSAEMRHALGSAAALDAVRDDLRQRFGTETGLVSEQVLRQGGYGVYQRTARWSGSDAPLRIVVALDAAGQVAGFFVRPQPAAARSPHPGYETQATLRLPVDGAWHVYWGGRTVEDNYHAVDQGQRFAIDLLVLQDGQSHAGDPRVPDSYHCWNRAIFAPGPGVVARVVDGLPDRPIGQGDPANPAGNHVVIDFGNGEYGFLAHLRQGSVAVAAGDRVDAGAAIGRCGNSGNSSEPHLHFHLQTTPELGRGEGLPARFVAYRADGRIVERGEPVKGQTIERLD